MVSKMANTTPPGLTTLSLGKVCAVLHTIDFSVVFIFYFFFNAIRRTTIILVREIFLSDIRYKVESSIEEIFQQSAGKINREFAYSLIQSPIKQLRGTRIGCLLMSHTYSPC